MQADSGRSVPVAGLRSRRCHRHSGMSEHTEEPCASAFPVWCRADRRLHAGRAKATKPRVDVSCNHVAPDVTAKANIAAALDPAARHDRTAPNRPIGRLAGPCPNRRSVLVAVAGWGRCRARAGYRQTERPSRTSASEQSPAGRCERYRALRTCRTRAPRFSQFNLAP